MSGKPISSFTFNVHNVQCTITCIQCAMCTIYTMYTMCTMYNVQLQLNFRVPMSFSPSPNVQTTFTFWKIFSQRICSSHCDIFTSPALHWNIKHPHLFGHWQDTLPENEIELSDFCGDWPTDINSHILHTVWSDFNPATDRAPTSHGIIQPLPPSSLIDLNTWQEIVYIPYHTNHIFKYSIHLRWCDMISLVN